jgi:hypothetical protein
LGFFLVFPGRRDGEFFVYGLDLGLFLAKVKENLLVLQILEIVL